MDDKLLKYFHGDDFAASTWENKYALRKDGELIEHSPDEMHMRLAKRFGDIESRYRISDSPYTSDHYKRIYADMHKGLGYETIYELFKNFEYIIPAGSVMSGLGSEKPVSLSNCFVLPSPKDSYPSIMETRMKQVELMKRRGGVGYDLSNLRPRGAAVNNAAITSTGAASFMDVNSDVTNEVSQNGRRGALMLSINVEHPDVEEFIEKKQDLTKVTGANVSVQVTDEFMKAVEKDEDYLLRWPVSDDLMHVLEIEGCGIYLDPYKCEKLEYGKLYRWEYPNGEYYAERRGEYGYIKKVRARDLWNKIIHCAWNTAEPGIIFRDSMINFAPDGGYEKYRMVSTNPCQPAWATVLTKNGLSTIGEIKIGDKIWSEEGWTTVVNKVSSGVKDVHQYRTTGGSFVGTENHKVICNGLKTEVKDCKEIDSLAGPFDPFTDESLDFDYNIVMDGLVLGDGMVHKASNNLIVLCIGKNDKEYFDSEIKDYIIGHRPGIREYAYKVITGVKPEELKPKYEIEIPERYMRGTRKEIRSLLRGLYSANGSVVSNRITYKTSSKKLCEQIQLLLSTIGINSYYTTNKSRSVKFSNGDYECKESYDVNISYDRDKFVSIIGFIQSYKNSKIDTTVVPSRRTKTRKIISDEIVSTEEVFDITVDNTTHTYWTGGVNVSNCGEIGMDGNNSCRLIALNLLSFVDDPFTENARINTEKTYGITYAAMRLCDDLVDLECEAVEDIIKAISDDDEVSKKAWREIYDKGKRSRRVGLEFTALSDMVAALGKKFCTEEGNAIVDKVTRLMMSACLDCQVDLAIERGVFPDADIKCEGKNEWFKHIKEEYPERYERMKNHGRRNISFTTAGPTGSLSILTRTSSGIEPLFLPYYVRRRKCMTENDRVDYVDKMGINFSEFVIVHPQLKEWAKVHYPNLSDDIDNGNLSESKWKELYEESPWYQACAQDIDWKKRVELQSIVQKNLITHSISSTVNLPNKVTEEEVSNIYLEAWRKGLKGITVYRDGSREGIIIQKEQKKEDDKFDSYISAPKRPKTLPADFYVTRVKGETFFVMVGLYHDKPYEIFVYKTHDDEKTSYGQHRGEITKIKRGVYKYTSDLLTIDNINGELTTEELATAIYSSMLLRHAAPLDCIIKTAQKVDDNITSFTSAMTRILKRYLKDTIIEGEVCPDCGGKLIRENGCIRCLDCGWSRCG